MEATAMGKPRSTSREDEVISRRVEMYQSSLERIEEIRDEAGMKQYILISRVLEWFCDLPENEQQDILRQMRGR